MNVVLAYLLRVAIGLDAFIQSLFHFGTLGITISSRAGTAAAHGHKWGLWMWWILDHLWPFSRSLKLLGIAHCAGAIQHDIDRAQEAIKELQDPVVTAYLKQQGNK